MLIAIPSKGRATKARTPGFISSGVLFVPESEEKDYRRHWKNEVVPVPIEIKGITATRNFILDYAKDRKWIVMIDDDVKKQGFEELFEQNGKHRSLTEKEWLKEWEKLFAVCEDTGFPIWGVSTDGTRRSVYPYKPFIWRTYVTASCMGILNGEIRFDERFQVKEDYEICLRSIRDFGGVVGCRFLCWVNDHWRFDGGCKDYRTQAMEEDAIRMLIKEYPGYIRQVTRGGSRYSIQLDF